VVPATTGHAVIEYSNRLLSGAVVAVAVITWVLAQRSPHARPALKRWSLAAAAASAGQAPLGAITVLSDLHPLAVGSHFLLSMFALACGTLSFVHARDRVSGRTRVDSRRAPWPPDAGRRRRGAGHRVVVTAPDRTPATRRWCAGGATWRPSPPCMCARRSRSARSRGAGVWIWREGGVDRVTRPPRRGGRAAHRRADRRGRIPVRHGLRGRS